MFIKNFKDDLRFNHAYMRGSAENDVKMLKAIIPSTYLRNVEERLLFKFPMFKTLHLDAIGSI